MLDRVEVARGRLGIAQLGAVGRDEAAVVVLDRRRTSSTEVPGVLDVVLAVAECVADEAAVLRVQGPGLADLRVHPPGVARLATRCRGAGLGRSVVGPGVVRPRRARIVVGRCPVGGWIVVTSFRRRVVTIAAVVRPLVVRPLVVRPLVVRALLARAVFSGYARFFADVISVIGVAGDDFVPVG